VSEKQLRCAGTESLAYRQDQLQTSIVLFKIESILDFHDRFAVNDYSGLNRKQNPVALFLDPDNGHVISFAVYLMKNAGRAL